MVAGLEEVSDGEIAIGPRVVNQIEPAERDNRHGVPELCALPAYHGVRQYGLWLKIQKVPEAEIKTRVDKAAKILELGALLERKPRELSGGQRQRVAMGRAIVRNPQVFLFDEPLSNLDAKLRAQTRLEIQKLHRELGVTSLFVTHDQVEAMTLAQRMIVMNGGRMEQFGTPEEVYGSPASTFVAGFMGSPPMNLLKGQVEGESFKLNGIALPLPAAAPRPGALTLGLRPEHVDRWSSTQTQSGAWPLRVEMIEMLGAERLVYGRLGEQAFTLRIDGTMTPPTIGDTLYLEVSARHLHWFDSETTLRVNP